MHASALEPVGIRVIPTSLPRWRTRSDPTRCVMAIEEMSGLRNDQVRWLVSWDNHRHRTRQHFLRARAWRRASIRSFVPAWGVFRDVMKSREGAGAGPGNIVLCSFATRSTKAVRRHSLPFRTARSGQRSLRQQRTTSALESATSSGTVCPSRYRQVPPATADALSETTMIGLAPGPRCMTTAFRGRRPLPTQARPGGVELSTCSERSLSSGTVAS